MAKLIKHTSAAIVMVILLAMLFVSCNNEVFTDSNNKQTDSLTLVKLITKADSLSDILPDSAIMHYKKAIAFTNELIEKHDNVDSTTTWQYRTISLAKRGTAVVYTNTGKLNEALIEIEEALDFVENYKEFNSIQYLQDYVAITNSKGVIQKKLGLFNDALKTYQNAVGVAMNNNDSTSIAIFYTNTGNIYQEIGEPNKALEYIEKALALHKEQKNERGIAISSLTLANILNGEGRFIEAKPYYETALNFCIENGYTGNIGLIQSNLGVLEKRIGNYHTAKNYFDKAIQNLTKVDNKQGLSLVYGNLADLAVSQENWDEAIRYANFQLEQAKQTNALVNQRYAYKHLSKAYAGIQKFDKAYQNHLLYSAINDSIMGIEKRNEISRLEAVYQDERKTEEISYLANLSSVLEKKNRTKSFLLLSISLLLLSTLLAAGLWVYNAKLKAKQQRLILEHRLLRSQMNPHFLFNSLSAIQNMVIRADKMVAAGLVANFAKFIRFILDSSRCNLVPLEKEIEAINLFIDLQKVRFPKLFTHKITLNIEDDPDDILVPPLIVQPFVENSIIHGFEKNRIDGEIDISFTQSEGYLFCRIVDNGVGMDNQKIKKEGMHKSVATQITRDRLNVLCKQFKCKASLEYSKPKIGINTQGTIVSLKLPLLFADDGNEKML